MLQVAPVHNPSGRIGWRRDKHQPGTVADRPVKARRVESEPPRCRHAIVSGSRARHTDLGWICKKPRISQHYFVSWTSDRHHRGEQGLLDTRSHTHVFGPICPPGSLRMVLGYEMPQLGQPSIHRIAILLIVYDSAGFIANNPWSLEVRLAYA